jgi:nicotinate-nucleotide adenylyltransferase
MAEVVALTRGGDTPELPVGVRPLATRRVDISATEIRARVAEGQSIRGFVPDAVAAYIAAHGLYR